ncbi:tRNA preQ1(34) S-adenosylmethionine ribosyltransferase-isomerase QueA [Amorphus orientalis]|uniref:tRNA preQ1(34) S-adenosylmethionine ribosyltransferase-isomerase QueA n=1 Tax=Amorphus orientalis TaxID=649198 RepID=UPI0027D88445|nr:tRNA preQ1(34) S-adenosylmethionine ribosyltransferase-isomerase QueA [Amorphus orientalis]
MSLTDFDFNLPQDRIALRPARPRDSARLLVVRPDEEPVLSDRIVRDLPDLLQPGDTLVFNDTRVIPAQLFGVRARGDAEARISATLHKDLGGARWRAFVRPAKRLREGEVIRFAADPDGATADVLVATVTDLEGGEATLCFDAREADLTDRLGTVGHVPLPPYIARRRGDDVTDKDDYQTIYARDPGSVAAPTAGLHFTEDLVGRLRARGIGTEFVTLHVGPGTFLPVKSDDLDAHHMHAEYGTVTPETADRLNAVRASGGRIVSVGTTSLRLLESAADETGRIHPFGEETAIFIRPGYRFRAVDVLMTNFHLPKSTLFMLVAAFSGLETMQSAYAHAIDAGYRFYSYGDACLLHRGTDR